MKKYLIPISLSIIFVSLLGIIRLQSFKSQSLSPLQTYKNDQYGFEFQYPSNLILSQDNRKITLTNNLKVRFHTPKPDIITVDNFSFIITSRDGLAKPNEELITDNNLVLGGNSFIKLYEGVEFTGEYTYLLINQPNKQTINFVHPVFYDLDVDETDRQKREYLDNQSQEELVNQILSTFKFTGSSLKTYKSDKYGFEFQYPSKYKVSNEGNEIITVSSDINTASSLLSFRFGNAKKNFIEHAGDIVKKNPIEFPKIILGDKSYPITSYFTREGIPSEYKECYLSSSSTKYAAVINNDLLVEMSVFENTECNPDGSKKISSKTTKEETNTAKQILSTFKFTK